MGRAYTEGMQGDDLTSRETVAACLKHYVGYGLPLSGRDRTPAWIDDRHMLEYFLPPFEESVRAGAVSVMINSGEVNGIPGHANYHLLTEILKETYQFQGFSVSDWVNIEKEFLEKEDLPFFRKILNVFILVIIQLIRLKKLFVKQLWPELI
jgi:beta-glucosidase